MTHSAFCIFADWNPHLPEELRSIPESNWLAKSRDGRWAQYIKINGERSQPYYHRSEILNWFKLRFGKVYPDCVASLMAAGFDQPQPENNKTKKKVVHNG